MVTYDPIKAEFSTNRQRAAAKSTLPSHYHVQFFSDPVTRAWVNFNTAITDFELLYDVKIPQHTPLQIQFALPRFQAHAWTPVIPRASRAFGLMMS